MENLIPNLTAAIDDSFGAGIREARERIGLTQGRVAELMRERNFSDFHQTTVYKIESGKRGVTLGEGLALAVIVKAGIQQLIEASANTVTAARQATERDIQDLRESLRLASGYLATARASQADLEQSLERLYKADDSFPKSKRDRDLDAEAQNLLAIDLDSIPPLFAFENESRGK